MKTTAFLLGAAMLVLGLAACGDPLENVSRAVTGDARDENEAEGDKLAIDGESSKIGWTGTKTAGKHDGGFNDFDGTITVNDGKVTQVDVTIQVESMWTDEDDADPDEDQLKTHLLSDDFFGAEEFPTARFVSTEIVEGGSKSHTVTGNLTLRGKTRSVTFPADIEVADDMVTAEAEFKIDRMEWDVEYQMPGAEIVIDNEVAIRLDVTARR